MNKLAGISVVWALDLKSGVCEFKLRFDYQLDSFEAVKVVQLLGYACK